MTLFNRVSRLFRADLHAVLDLVEEPDLLLRQAVREMEEDLAKDRRRQDLMQEGRRSLEARRGEAVASLERIAEELDVCFAADKQGLARVLLRRRLETEQSRDMLSRGLEARELDLEGLRRRITRNGERLEAMRQKLELLAPEPPPEGPTEVRDSTGLRVRDEDVEVALLREQQRRAVS